ncbi:uncharacterized protein LOC101452586 isoform X2 [Ceratitis capitata]|uniref:uncharacterized protein LOC101452586 isoform X2 n=1 Tax=Ceratitis capitata TaxID=7213 RepID=UPI000A112887|nr:uncharacterized protein LOC101452586 isoform X2 [Ceratitis capitata]
MKRVKGIPVTNWKLAKLETNSSPNALTTEFLEDMGIGVLDSEESSSSAASSIALVLSASADENSNGVTPNIDVPKMCHQRFISYRPLDNTLDSTFNSDTNDNTLITTPGKSMIENDAKNTVSQLRDNNSSALDTYGNDSKINMQQQQQLADKLLVQYKKAAIVGIGASITSTSTSITSTAPQIYNTCTNSNSPSTSRNTRSPLSTVTGNNNIRTIRNATSHTQQQQVIKVPLPHVSNNAGSSSSSYMCLPSTSKQSMLMKQQQQQQQQLQQQKQEEQRQQLQQQQQCQEQQYRQQQHQDVKIFCQNQPTQSITAEQQASLPLYDNFFLFRQHQYRDHLTDGKDYFNTLSDEIILQIFKWLPKKALIRCSYVCRRFNSCARDESLWTRLDLAGRHLRAGAMENILTRGVVILRMAQAELSHPVFESEFLHAEPKYESKLQYLDLSMVSVTKPSLKMLLSRCRQLKKLSLEHVPINDEICNEIAKNTNLEALNLAMCIGLEAWSVRKIMECLQNLNSLNISWTNLSVDAVTSVVTNVTPNLMRLNMAGCRKTMYDSHVASLVKRCPQLLEVDFSDCTALTGNVINIICKFKMLEYLSLSRCYLIPASSYMDLANLPSLTYLDVFGMLSDTGLELLEQNFPNIGINKFIHSSVARPTVGTRRTSIWGLRTRD